MDLSSNVETVPNLQDWLTEDFELLIKSNKSGTLTYEPGGVRVYLKKEQDKKNEIMKEVAESKGTNQIQKMTRTINRGNIYIRKLISINKSKGIVLPARFVKKV